MTKTFPRAGWFHHGYDPRKVDEFLAQAKQFYDTARAFEASSESGNSDAHEEANSHEKANSRGESDARENSRGKGITDEDVHSVSFPWVRNGYQAPLVDAALDRLERAYVQHRRASQVRTEGEEEWLRIVYDRATSLYPRLRRPVGQRFAHPEKKGYAREEVDALMERIVAFFNEGKPLTAREVRQATFAQARGKKAYAEAVVDAYLDRVVSVLLSVE